MSERLGEPLSERLGEPLSELTMTVFYKKLDAQFESERVVEHRLRDVFIAQFETAVKVTRIVFPNGLAREYEITSIRVGRAEQLPTSGPVPMEAFSELAMPVALSLDIVQPGELLQVGIRHLSSIDWSVFDKYSESTNTCRCGATFKSHTKYVAGRGIVSRVPCPGCGKTDYVFRSVGEPEVETLRTGNIGALQEKK